MRARSLTILSLIALVLATVGVTAGFAQTDGDTDQREVFTTELAPLNDSGVSGSATVVREGTTLTILSDVAGVAPALPHAQHLHGALDGSADNVCPPTTADADDDGFITVAEGAPFYGGIQVSLTTTGDTTAESALAVERFPAPEDDTFTYVRMIEVSQEIADAAADLSYVVHGIDINDNGEYDFDNGESSINPDLPLEATIPAACGELEAAEGADVDAFAANLTALNDSGAQSTATIVRDGSTLTVGIEGDGFAPGLPHAQHLHASLEDGADNVCPPTSADEDDDGFITTAEGVPSYGGIQVSLTTTGDTSADSGLAVDRFPVADEDGTISYVRSIEDVDQALLDALPDVVGVQHGIDINGNGEYDAEAGQSSIDPELPLEATIPAVCGEFLQAGGMDGGEGEQPETEREIGRVAGDTRITTAIQVSQRAFPDGSDVVYIAAQDVNPDALVGGVLTDGPILLVPAEGDLPQVVADEIERLGAETVLALGGPATVSQEILVQAANA